MTSSNAINFQAQWAPYTNHIKPAPSTDSLTKRVYDFVRSVVLFIPNTILESFIRWNILPSSSSLVKWTVYQPYIRDFKNFWIKGSKDPQNLWNKAWNKPLTPHVDSYQSVYIPTELSMTTPDKVPLGGVFLKHKDHDSNQNSRVIMLFHGNGAIYQQFPVWMMDLLQSSPTPYSFMLFNPRNVGDNTQGTPNSNNLLLDAETAYQLLKEKLNIPEDRIDIYGQSLGGAQAVQLKALHPETKGRLLLDRTFSNLDVETSHMLGRLPKFIKNFAIKLIKRFGWEFNNYEALKKIKDEVHVFYHNHDPIIPESCSLGKAVADNNPNPAKIFVHKYASESTHIAWHNLPLTILNLVEDPKYKDSQALLTHIFTESS